jgi:hypothetical protein
VYALARHGRAQTPGVREECGRHGWRDLHANGSDSRVLLAAARV